MGYPLQSSCLGNPMDRGAWRATVQTVTESDKTEQQALGNSSGFLVGRRGLLGFPWIERGRGPRRVIGMRPGTGVSLPPPSPSPAREPGKFLHPGVCLCSEKRNAL